MTTPRTRPFTRMTSADRPFNVAVSPGSSYPSPRISPGGGASNAARRSFGRYSRSGAGTRSTAIVQGHVADVTFDGDRLADRARVRLQLRVRRLRAGDLRLRGEEDAFDCAVEDSRMYTVSSS